MKVEATVKETVSRQRNPTNQNCYIECTHSERARELCVFVFLLLSYYFKVVKHIFFSHIFSSYKHTERKTYKHIHTVTEWKRMVSVHLKKNETDVQQGKWKSAHWGIKKRKVATDSFNRDKVLHRSFWITKNEERKTKTRTETVLSHTRSEQKTDLVQCYQS